MTTTLNMTHAHVHRAPRVCWRSLAGRRVAVGLLVALGASSAANASAVLPARAATTAQDSGAADPTDLGDDAPAEPGGATVAETEFGDPAAAVAIRQRLGAMLPLDAEFTSGSGERVQLGRYFGGERPVILSIVYFECPQLCTQILTNLVTAIRVIERYEVGTDYDVVVASIDPRETAELAGKKKEAFVRRYGREGTEDGFHFLVGEEGPIDRLAKAAGYGYRYDPRIDEYAHAAGIMIVTPDGRLSHYFYGMDYAARDIQLALVESSGGSIGSLVEEVLLLCLRYDPASGTYGFAAMASLRILGVLTLAGMLVFIVRQLRRERARRAAGSGTASMNGPCRTATMHAAQEPAAEL